MNTALHFSSETVEHGTPQNFFDALNASYNFTLDPCATAENAKCKKFFTIDDNGLAQSWANEIVFMNPPYGSPETACKGLTLVEQSDLTIPVHNAKGEVVAHTEFGTCNKKKCLKRGYHVSEYVPGIIDWMRKAYESAKNDGAVVVCLIPARMDTDWMQTFVLDKGKVNPKKCEVDFIKGRLVFGTATSAAPFPNLVAVFRGKRKGLK